MLRFWTLRFEAMGGREAVRALRALDPEVRAVVMSGHSDDQVMQEYSQHGFKAAHQAVRPRGFAPIFRAS